MYENRVTAFIDILGFRNIISKSIGNTDFTKKIYEVLNSMKADSISDELFIDVAPNIPEEEMEDVSKIAKLFSKAVKSQSSVQVTHFSDSIVLSIGLDNDMNVMSVLEYIGRLMYRLWNEFNILIRGAITIGELVHLENGALFGPAMVKAYDLETNLANYPRIIIDDYTSKCILTSPHYKNMTNLFIDFSAAITRNGREYTVAKGLEINLKTVLDHLINSHFIFNNAKKIEVENTIRDAITNLEQLKSETEKIDVQEKYNYLINFFS
ncbi:hypothetical protein [Flavobacterium sp.]|uniref:hypothetical protein n=1 Tax=Flavobacterium sp. TaxID=239 RepID=UPI0026356526|nr:hypothetical protein [Flavobacterium sp.]